ILLPGFQAMAKQVSHSELEGTGVQIPKQGISVNGPLEDAFKQISHLLAHTPKSSTDNNNTVPLSIISTSNSQDTGVEFDPKALIELDLCTVFNLEGKSLPPEMAEQSDSGQWLIVELTPIGSMAMEMIWAGGLALTSFG
ncbi:hypothetical protein GYMLUDRAFT_145288, partial [Collybiopsis luxurians FD-317 M1]